MMMARDGGECRAGQQDLRVEVEARLGDPAAQRVVESLSRAAAGTRASARGMAALLLCAHGCGRCVSN